MGIQYRSMVDNRATRISVAASTWVLVYSYGSNITGPFVATVILQPELFDVLWTLFVLILLLPVLFKAREYVDGRRERGTLFRIASLTLVAQFLVQAAFQQAAMDGWFVAIAFPFPVLTAVVVLVALRARRSSLVMNH
jgi:hypothetical protein